MPGLQLRFTVEEVEPFSVWHGYRGRLSQIMLGLMAHDYLEREVFCCGPEPFMKGVREMLASLGFDMAHYHQESFSALAENAEDIPVSSIATGDIEIVFEQSGSSISSHSEETILAAARRAGLNIPSGCNFGLCGTCKVKKNSGDVTMVHNGGISDDEISEGYILACCSRPLGLVTISI